MSQWLCSQLRQGNGLYPFILGHALQQRPEAIQVGRCLRVAAFDEVVMMHDGNDDWVKRSKGAKRIERGLE